MSTDTATPLRDEDLGIDTRVPGALAHNMSSPPKSIVSFGGLGSVEARDARGSKPIRANTNKQQAIFGTPIHFALRGEWRDLQAPDLLQLIDGDAKRCFGAAATSRLHKLIEQRAASMPLPDGCVTIPTNDSHRVVWPDLLSVLAVVTKCTATVWLRNKAPSLLAARERRSTSLLVPPTFLDRLPAPTADIEGGNDGH